MYIDMYSKIVVILGLATEVCIVNW